MAISPKKNSINNLYSKRLPQVIVQHFLYQLIFWIVLFNCQRVVFLITNPDVLNNMPEYFGVFFYSFRLDLATTAFLVALPTLLFALVCFFPNKYFKWILYSFVILEILLTCAIHAGEMVVYEEWKHKLTSKVFLHLFHGNEVMRTADDLSILWFFLILIIEFSIGFTLFRYFFIKPINKFGGYRKKWDALFISITTLIIMGLSFLFARGGWQQIPINIDSAYYSDNVKLNDISINSTYYFANSYLLYLNSDIESLVPKIDISEADSISKKLYNKNHQDTTRVLTTDKPNIVLIILEGWSANVIGCMSKTKGATPNFDELVNSGLLFSNIYATNTTSEIGHTSILAGFPALPEITISSYPEKHRNLTTINQTLKKKNYHSGYLFGGDLTYGNIESFINEHEMDEVWDEDDFPSGKDHGKLSYHDEDVLALFLERINKSTSPFFRAVFTASTHAPFDHPKQPNQKWSGKESDYMNSIIYADKCLGDFFRKAKKESWYKNTLFVVVADHSHSCPTHEVPYSVDFFKIPLLFYGDVIKKSYVGTKIKKIGSQADLAATLLAQLGADVSTFPYSKNLLDPTTTDFAFIATVRGYGFTNLSGKFMYHFDAKKYHEQTFSPRDFSVSKKISDALFRSYYEYFKNLEYL